MKILPALLRSVCLSFAVGALLATAPLRAADVPAASPQDVRPLAPGSPMPAATVQTMDGAPVALTELLADKPTVLIVFRGGWCPYCTQHMAELAELEPRLVALGVQIVALSTDQPRIIRFFTQEKNLPYRLLSDRDMQASRALGLAFRIPPEMQKKYAEWNIDLPPIPGEPDARWLPVPAAFVVGRDGTVRFVHADPDYKVRISGEKLLAAVQEMLR